MKICIRKHVIENERSIFFSFSKLITHACDIRAIFKKIVQKLKKVEMGKHINARQEEMVIDFMEKYPNLAKGFVKEDRVEVEKLWQTLTANLNSIGPPMKGTEAWKKAWSDKKCQIRRKLAINVKEDKATGGGPHNQIYISSQDEAIARLCGLYDIADGIEGNISYGYQRTAVQEEPSMHCPSSGEEEEELPTSSSQP